MFVIVRTDGKYVAVPGMESSYTDRLELAQRFSTRQQAERNRCIENETVVHLDNLLSRTER